MNKIDFFTNVLMCATIILSLSACSALQGNPTPLPSGYTHQHKVYKAAPGPSYKNRKSCTKCTEQNTIKDGDNETAYSDYGNLND